MPSHDRRLPADSTFLTRRIHQPRRYRLIPDERESLVEYQLQAGMLQPTVCPQSCASDAGRQARQPVPAVSKTPDQVRLPAACVQAMPLRRLRMPRIRETFRYRRV